MSSTLLELKTFVIQNIIFQILSSASCDKQDTDTITSFTSTFICDFERNGQCHLALIRCIDLYIGKSIDNRNEKDSTKLWPLAKYRVECTDNFRLNHFKCYSKE